MASSKGRWWHWGTGDKKVRGLVFATSREAALREARICTHRRIYMKPEKGWEPVKL